MRMASTGDSAKAFQPLATLRGEESVDAIGVGVNSSAVAAAVVEGDWTWS